MLLSAVSTLNTLHWGYEKAINLRDSYCTIKDIGLMETNSEIISRLKFIGKIQEYEKINVKGLYVQPCNMYTKISRTFINVDNRRNTYNFFVKTLERSFEITSVCVTSERLSDRELAKNIIVDIQRACIGIGHTKKTYSTDIMYCCQIDTLIQDIHARLSEYYKRYPSLAPLGEDHITISIRDTIPSIPKVVSDISPPIPIRESIKEKQYKDDDVSSFSSNESPHKISCTIPTSLSILKKDIA